MTEEEKKSFRGAPFCTSNSTHYKLAVEQETWYYTKYRLDPIKRKHVYRIPKSFEKTDPLQNTKCIPIS